MHISHMPLLVWGPGSEDPCNVLSLRMALKTHMTLSSGSHSMELNVMLSCLSNTHINIALQNVTHHFVGVSQ